MLGELLCFSFLLCCVCGCWCCFVVCMCGGVFLFFPFQKHPLLSTLSHILVLPRAKQRLICCSDISENLHGSVTVAYGIVIMFNFVDSMFAGKQIHLFIFKVYFPQFMLLKELYPARTESLTAKAYDINVLLCCSNDQCNVLKVFCLVSPVVFAACVDLDVSYVSNKLLNP